MGIFRWLGRWNEIYVIEWSDFSFLLFISVACCRKWDVSAVMEMGQKVYFVCYMILHALIEFSPWKWKKRTGIKMIHSNDCNHWHCNCFCNATIYIAGELIVWTMFSRAWECNRMKQIIGVVLCGTPNRWMSISSMIRGNAAIILSIGKGARLIHWHWLSECSH